LIFAVEGHIEQIKNLTKTMTRRAWKKPLVRAGRIYGLQPGRTKPKIQDGAILVTKIFREFRGSLYSPEYPQISRKDALAEGGYTPSEFMKLYNKMHSKWESRYVVTFRYLPRQFVPYKWWHKGNAGLKPEDYEKIPGPELIEEYIVFQKSPKFLSCSCGWFSGPWPPDTMFAGPGGQLMCPVCTQLQRNKNIEVYGSVVIVAVHLPRYLDFADHLQKLRYRVHERLGQWNPEIIRKGTRGPVD